MKRTKTYRIYLLSALIGTWGLLPVLQGQNCFSVNIAQSKAALLPSGETTLPENGDTLALLCTQAIPSFSFHIDFEGDTEKFFEDSTMIQATLAYKTTTLILSYNKSTNTLSLPPTAPPLFFDGTYVLTVLSIMCPQTPPPCDNCTITYSFRVHYVNDPNFSVSIQTDPSPAILTCLPGSAATLIGTPLPHSGFTCQWSRLVNMHYDSIPGATSASYTTDMAGTYLYAMEGPAQCKASNFSTISSPQKPAIVVAQAEQPLNACSQFITGVTIENGGPTANLETAWTTSGSGILVSGQTTLDPVIAALGTYTLVSKRLDNGCADTATVVVVPGIIPTVIAQISSLTGTDVLDCKLTDITLRATASLSSGTSAYTYLWPDGSVGDEFTVNAPGIYSVTVTAVDIGCQGAADFAVFQDVSFPDLQIIRSRDTVCAGESVVLTAFATELVTYRWQNNATTNSLTAMPGQSGPNPYSVTVTANDNGCTNSASVLIERLDPPLVSCVQNDLTVQSGSRITLDCPQTGTLLIWLAVASNVRNIPPSGEGPIQDRQMTLISTRAPGTVHFSFYAKNAGCTSDRADVTVTVLPESPGGIFVPELVTPNGDGLNDTWEIALPSSMNNPGDYRITLFDRHGSFVNEGTLAAPPRADTYPDGTYYYVISKPDGDLIRGAVTILRRQ